MAKNSGLIDMHKRMAMGDLKVGFAKGGRVSGHPKPSGFKPYPMGKLANSKKGGPNC